MSLTLKRILIFAGVLSAVITLVIYLNSDRALPESVRQDPNVIQLRFESWLPRLAVGGMTGLTIGHNVYITLKKEQLNPCGSEGDRQFLKHELIHVEQYEGQGMVDYVLGYYGGLFWNWIFSGFNAEEAYLKNAWEAYANYHQKEVLTLREYQVVTRYYPQCAGRLQWQK